MQKDIVNEILKLSLKLWISFHKIQSWILNSVLRWKFFSKKWLYSEFKANYKVGLRKKTAFISVWGIISKRI